MTFKTWLLAVATALALVGCGGGGAEQPAAPSLAPVAEVPARPDSLPAEATPVQLYLAFYGVAPSYSAYMDLLGTMNTSGPHAAANRLADQFWSFSDTQLAGLVLANMGVTAASTNSTAYAVLSQALGQIFGAYANQRGSVVLQLVNLLEDLESNATYGAAARTFNSNALAAYLYGTNPANVTQGGPILSGVAAKGPLKNAAVDVYNLKTDGTKGTWLASGTTSSDGSGQFSVPLPSRPAGGVLIEVSGGTYSSGYDGATLTSQSMSAILPSVSATGESGLSVNPLTDMSVALMRSYYLPNYSQSYSMADLMATADRWVATAFGLTTAPTRLVPRFDVTQVASNPEAVHLAMVLAALDTLGKRLYATSADTIFAVLSADMSDGFFDGKAGSSTITVNGTAVATTVGTTEFLKAFAVTFSSSAAGWRPTYVDAHFNAGTITEAYQARIIPVYVASDLAQYYPAALSSPLPNTTSLDAQATGYSCASGAQVSFDENGNATCGQGAYYTCSTGTLVVSGSRFTCSDGGMPAYHSAEIPLYTAPTVTPYSAATITPYTAAPVIGAPAADTLPVFRASAVHVFTDAERAAMMANDRAAGDAAAAKVSSLGVPNPLQLEWMQKINDAVIASVR